ncbi:MAG TPA: hypothetical protein VMY76_04840 [Gemmatimonadales bacterium]|nr:hypothetical protein [Gemmatimonadales bacterium]
MRVLLIVLSIIPPLYVALVGWREAGPSGFLLGVLLWNLVPVLIGGRLAYSRFERQGLGWLGTTLAASVWAIWVGLLHPRGSTAALIFLVLPAWNVALVGPVGALLAGLVGRLGRGKPA